MRETNAFPAEKTQESLNFHSPFYSVLTVCSYILNPFLELKFTSILCITHSNLRQGEKYLLILTSLWVCILVKKYFLSTSQMKSISVQH